MQKGVAVAVTDLEAGMHVLDLDRPWLETPFLLEGFIIQEANEIQTLRQFCQYVYVDENTIPKHFKGKFDEAHNTIGALPEPVIEQFPEMSDAYQDLASVEEEIDKAKLVTEQLMQAAEKMFDGLNSDDDLDLSEVEGATKEMVSSMVRNPDAMIWLMRVKDWDSYAYNHAIGSSVWAVAVGRQLGLSQMELDDLALGTLLCDIGKTRIDRSLLTKPGKLTPEEFEIVKTHVEHGLDILKEQGITNTNVINIVANHHERFNGQGYPRALKANQIPVFARIAAIADCYDAMISHRVFQEASSPGFAVKKLYEWRNVDFQPELVETFIQVVGVFPASSLVELHDGRVAIVVAEGRKNRLKPKVLIILDENKEMLMSPELVNLAEKGDNVGIKGTLPVNAYGIDPREFFI